MNRKGELLQADPYGGQSLFGSSFMAKMSSGTKANLSGNSFEVQVYRKLRDHGYEVTRERVMIPSIYGDGHKRIDIHIFDPGIAVSCKNQRVDGSTEEKMWGEIIQLQHICDNQEVVKAAWIILGGTAMKHTEYWISRDWKDYIEAPDVRVFHFDSWPLEPRLL